MECKEVVSLIRRVAEHQEVNWQVFLTLTATVLTHYSEAAGLIFGKQLCNLGHLASILLINTPHMRFSLLNTFVGLIH